MRRALGMAGALALFFVAAVASARPVPIGRYVEIPYGIAEDHPHPTEGGGPSRAGRSRHPVPAQAPTKQWEARVPIGRAFPPAVDRDGRLYVAGMAGVSSLTPAGQVRWSVRLGFTSGTPSITPDGHVAVGTQAGELVVISREGEVLVRTRVGGAVRGAPLVLADGSIVAGGFDRSVQRVDAEGRLLFRAEVDQQVQGTPAWAPGSLIAVPVGRDLVFLSPSGEEQARASLGVNVVSGPAVADDGTVWVLTGDGALHAVETTGRVRSRTELGMRASLATTFAVGRDGAVRIGGREEQLVCVGPAGTERWRLDTEGAFPGGITVDDDGVALGVNHEGRMLAIDAEGTVRFRAELGTRVHGAPVIAADGTIYIVTERGTLQAWR